eukprot:g2961.t1
MDEETQEWAYSSGGESDSTMETTQRVPHAELLVLKVGNELPKSRLCFHLFEGENTIGRRPESDVVLDFDWISGLHATIDVIDVGIDGASGGFIFLLKDRGSRNHTFVHKDNKKAQLKPKVAARICDGDTITFGNVNCQVSMPQQTLHMTVHADSRAAGSTAGETTAASTKLFASVSGHEAADEATQTYLHKIGKDDDEINHEYDVQGDVGAAAAARTGDSTTVMPPPPPRRPGGGSVANVAADEATEEATEMYPKEVEQHSLRQLSQDDEGDEDCTQAYNRQGGTCARSPLQKHAYEVAKVAVTTEEGATEEATEMYPREVEQGDNECTQAYGVLQVAGSAASAHTNGLTTAMLPPPPRHPGCKSLPGAVASAYDEATEDATEVYSNEANQGNDEFTQACDDVQGWESTGPAAGKCADASNTALPRLSPLGTQATESSAKLGIEVKDDNTEVYTELCRDDSATQAFGIVDDDETQAGGPLPACIAPHEPHPSSQTSDFPHKPDSRYENEAASESDQSDMSQDLLCDVVPTTSSGINEEPHRAEEEEAKRKAEEEATKRKAAEEEAERKAVAEAAQRKAEEEEANRKAAEEAAKRKAEEEEAQ